MAKSMAHGAWGESIQAFSDILKCKTPCAMPQASQPFIDSKLRGMNLSGIEPQNTEQGIMNVEVLKTSAFYIPCSIFDIQSRIRDCADPDQAGTVARTTFVAGCRFDYRHSGLTRNPQHETRNPI